MNIQKVFLHCPHCETDWTEEQFQKHGGEHSSVSNYVEYEGCPDCLWECERCGMLKDQYGSFEHCL